MDNWKQVMLRDCLRCAGLAVADLERQLAEVRAQRDDLILEALDKGLSEREIGRWVGISGPAVHQVRKRDQARRLLAYQRLVDEDQAAGLI